MAGSTNCVPLINGYLNADNDFMDELMPTAQRRASSTILDTLREGTEDFDFGTN